MLREELTQKTKEQLIDLIIAYDNYIKDFDEDFQCLDRTPIYVSEYLNNEFAICDLKVGNYVVITYTEDTDLENWLDEQEEKGITQHKIVEVDTDTQIFWVENCDYGIWFSDEYDIITKGDEK